MLYYNNILYIDQLIQQVALLFLHFIYILSCYIIIVYYYTLINTTAIKYTKNWCPLDQIES